ncbi:DDE-type integrase/transposase/recombinase [Anaerobacillus sp. CMMVII]|uniref:TnsA endonuclease N-terminal domain-containing protein n=1 Tax=Anaerobacillus sp. CMMVII TaxID=2755588 RepID=UPI0021B82FDF|nr:TnsA endonuclease N-terminal domain-containing protein [Anaerobacillus sp. CMMVII]MCT8140271.1 DDE-type integrase/transposase/recombinase [Anaerobacillus sp. CMMVII]
MMIADIESFFRNNNLPVETQNMIISIRNSEPARRVRSNGKNVTGFYPSKKMGVTIQFESHKLELCAIYEKEFDEKVLEYYDQPQSFPINYMVNGKKRGHRYTADFFVISTDFIGWEEWKMEKDMEKLSEKYPERYNLDENGKWRCPPAEQHANQFGLAFRVRTSNEINWTLQRNLRFLEDYLYQDNPYVLSDIKELVLGLVAEKPELTLDNLLTKHSVFTADDVYTLIALGDIYVDLETYLITDFDKFPLFINKEIANAVINIKQSNVDNDKSEPLLLKLNIGNQLNWNGRNWAIINVGEETVTLLSETEDIINLKYPTFKDLIKKGLIIGIKKEEMTENHQLMHEILIKASVEELKEANEKYFKLQSYLKGEKPESLNVPSRTLRYWKFKYVEAEKLYGNGYAGLLPARHKQGNRLRKLPPQVLDLIDLHIGEGYENIRQKNMRTVHNLLSNECIEKGFSPPSYMTFSKEVKKRPIHEQTRKRKGTKGSYDTEQFYFELSLTTPRHGDRPFEICHIDHTELDIELICSTTNKNLGRPWITFLIDAYSRKILAFYLTFDPPSYRSCLMVIRECVRIQSRLPSQLVVDGGKEFQSVYFETLLARYNVEKKNRPGAKPRFGSVVERLFGTTNTVFIHNLLGNTKIMKNVREVTKKVNPKNNAVWTLEKLYEALSTWSFDIYDTKLHSSLDECPRDAYLNRIAKTGMRECTFISYDETFKMMTLPSTKKGTAKVQTGMGVKINNFYYWSDALLNPEIEGKQITVRYDPFNMGIAYAYVNKYWVKLRSEFFIILENRTEKEVKMASTEIRRRKKLNGTNSSLSGAEVARFLESLEGDEILHNQRAKDRALKCTFEVIEGGKSSGKQTSSNVNQKNKILDKKGIELVKDKENKHIKKAVNNFVLYEEF